MTDHDRSILNRLFFFLCLSQILASLIKYILVGVGEPYIGTMSTHSGGLTTLFSLFGFSSSVIFYLAYNKKYLLLMSLGFIIFGLIGEKRALVIMIPSVLLYCYFVYFYFLRKINAYFFKKIVVVILLIPLLFYIIARANPSFNPKHVVWGEFDYEYVIDYIDKYNTDGAITKSADIGRSLAHAKFLNQFFDQDLFTIFFGYGSGLLVQSSFNKEAWNDGGVEAFSLKKWGVGYGMSIGYLRMRAQVGVFGFVVYFLIYLSFIVALYKKLVDYSHIFNRFDFSTVLSVYVCVSIMIILSLIYNSASFNLNPVTMIVFWFLAYSLKNNKYENYS